VGGLKIRRAEGNGKCQKELFTNATELGAVEWILAFEHGRGRRHGPSTSNARRCKPPPFPGTAGTSANRRSGRDPHASFYTPHPLEGQKLNRAILEIQMYHSRIELLQRTRVCARDVPPNSDIKFALCRVSIDSVRHAPCVDWNAGFNCHAKSPGARAHPSDTDYDADLVCSKRQPANAATAMVPIPTTTVNSRVGHYRRMCWTPSTRKASNGRKCPGVGRGTHRQQAGCWTPTSGRTARRGRYESVSAHGPCRSACSGLHLYRRKPRSRHPPNSHLPTHAPQPAPPERRVSTLTMPIPYHAY
jgi:hypothetical protein